MLSFYCIKPSDWLVVPLLLIQHIGSVLAEILASMLDVSIMQWSFPKFDLSSSIAMQFVLSAVMTTFDDMNVGSPTTGGTSSALIGKCSRYSSGVSTL